MMQIIAIMHNKASYFFTRKIKSYFSKTENMRFVYQHDHMSPEYIFQNQYVINCLFKSKAFKNAVDHMNELLRCYCKLV